MPFPDQASAGDWSVIQAAAPDILFAAIQLLTELNKSPGALALEAPVGQLLDSVGQPGFEESPVERGRLLVLRAATRATTVSVTGVLLGGQDTPY